VPKAHLSVPPGRDLHSEEYPLFEEITPLYLRSVKKFACLNVLLLGIVVSLGINSKEELQSLAEQ
jgi:hypothetical protein